MTAAVPYTAETLPPDTARIFDVLDRARLTNGVLYGGALRDYDNDQPSKVKDYDLALFVGGDPSVVRQAVEHLQNIADVVPGSCRELSRNNFEVRLSGMTVPLHLVFYGGGAPKAEHLALWSDIGLSGIAMNSDGRAFVHPEYLSDKANYTLTLLDRDERTAARAQRLQKEKYPNHRIIPGTRVAAVSTLRTLSKAGVGGFTP
jgi:hypothetical protein